MAFFTLQDAYEAADRASSRTGRMTDSLIEDHRRVAKSLSTYDVFLSHSSSDRRLIFGVKQILEDQGFSVYIDWIDDPHLDRSKVTASTADVLRLRMRASKSFLYATSDSATVSKWMPWEIGFYDGTKRGQIAIFPLVASSSQSFQGQEYLGLYPYIEKITNYSTMKQDIGMAKTASTYLPIRDFVIGSSETKIGIR